MDLWVRKILWRRKQQPIPVFLPGKSARERSLAGYSSRGHKRVRYDLVTKQQQEEILIQRHLREVRRRGIEIKSAFE